MGHVDDAQTLQRPARALHHRRGVKMSFEVIDHQPILPQHVGSGPNVEPLGCSLTLGARERGQRVLAIDPEIDGRDFDEHEMVARVRKSWVKWLFVAVVVGVALFGFGPVSPG